MISAQDLLNYKAETASDRIRFQAFQWKIIGAPGYDAWADLVEDAVYDELQHIHNQRHSLQNLEEDAITVMIVRSLISLGFMASRETHGGNCDLVVSGWDFTWLGEAKINTGVSKVWKGYLQLLARYASGLAGQNRGGMLIYCYDRDATESLVEWQAALSTEKPDSAPTPGRYPLTFSSSDTVPSTGLGLKICHYSFPLLYAPQETGVKLSAAALKAGQDAKKALIRSPAASTDVDSSNEGTPADGTYAE